QKRTILIPTENKIIQSQHATSETDSFYRSDQPIVRLHIFEYLNDTDSLWKIGGGTLKKKLSSKIHKNPLALGNWLQADDQKSISDDGEGRHVAISLCTD